MGDWWESVVRVRAPHTIGSGTLFRPNAIVTAAHVVSDGPGMGSVPTDALRVVTMYGTPIVFRVLAVRLAKEWTQNDGLAHLHDIAVLLVDPPHPNTIPTEFDYGVDGGLNPATAFGYVGDGLIQARYRSGTVMRDGDAFRSTDIDPDDGMSGGAVVTRSDPPRLVGVIRSKPAITGTSVIIALPLLHKVIDPLLA